MGSKYTPQVSYLCLNGIEVGSKGINADGFCTAVKGISGWTRGQLEVLPGSRKEEQGEKEQVFSEAPQSKDGAEGLMLCTGTVHFAVMTHFLRTLPWSAGRSLVTTRSSGDLDTSLTSPPGTPGFFYSLFLYIRAQSRVSRVAPSGEANLYLLRNV